MTLLGLAFYLLGWSVLALSVATLIRLEVRLDRIDKKIGNWKLYEPPEDYVRFVQRDPLTAFLPKGRTQ